MRTKFWHIAEGKKKYHLKKVGEGGYDFQTDILAPATLSCD
jgi:hypothetical protein